MLVGCNVGVRHLRERQSRLGGIFGAGCAALADRVDRLPHKLAGSASGVAGFGKGYIADRS
jgi:hypothetical protein